MLNSNFFKSRNTIAIIIVALVSSIIFLTSYMVQNGQFTFLNRASSSWNVTKTPPACTGSWKVTALDKTVDKIGISGKYSVSFDKPTNVILFDWDNDPKGSGSSKEIGHIFTIDGTQFKVPEQSEPDDLWSTTTLTGVKSITYNRNEDSGGSNICVLGSSTTPTKTPTPKPSATLTPTKSPTPKPSTTATPTKSPTPTVPRTPTPTGPRICEDLDADIVLVLDRSSSMNSKEADGRTKLEWAKEAAASLVDRIANTEGVKARISIVSFGAQGNDGTGAKDTKYNSTLHIALTSNYASVKTAVTNVKYIESGTCIECGIRIANDQLENSTSPNKVVILLSDGRANHNWGGTSTDAKAKAIAAANAGRTEKYTYYVLGYGSDADTTTLKAIAGSDTRYRYKPDAKDWPEAFLSILDQICQEITPTPTNTPTNTPTKTPTPTNTPTPTDKPTDTPTKTPTPTNPMCVIPVVENVRITCPICQ